MMAIHFLTAASFFAISSNFSPWSAFSGFSRFRGHPSSPVWPCFSFPAKRLRDAQCQFVTLFGQFTEMG